MLAVITVTSFADDGGGAKLTLREAIEQANTNLVPDTIQFSTDPADGLNGATITLTLDQLSITEGEDLTIDASMLSNGITIVAAADSRIFDISGGGDVTLDSLTLTGGNVTAMGGAVRSSSTNLTVLNSTITGNATLRGSGGGIASVSGSLVVQDSQIYNNSAGDDDASMARGGGIYFFDEVTYAANLEIRSSTISGNSSHGSFADGGGLFIRADHGSVVIDDATIDGNTIDADGGDGGGICLYTYDSSVTITNTTISNNHTFGTAENNAGGMLIRAKNESHVWIEGVLLQNNSASDDTGGLMFEVDGGTTVMLKDSTISGNWATHNYPYVYDENYAGGMSILAAANTEVTLENSIISGNRTETAMGQVSQNISGGGLVIITASTALVTMLNSMVSDNRAEGSGGGIYIRGSGEVNIRHSTITGNWANSNGDAVGSGGGIHIASTGGTITIDGSTISDNHSQSTTDSPPHDLAGGGLSFDDSSYSITTIINSTISGNSAAGPGGGIHILGIGEVNILHSTITNNRADSDDDDTGTGGGIYRGNSSITVTLDHTIVAKNYRGPGTTTRSDVTGAVTASWSLVGDDTGATIIDSGGNQIGSSGTPIDPMLGPLTNNGGQVFLDGSRMLTHAVLPVSPARNAGNTNTSGFPQYDQRGADWSRVVDGRIDIGAFERQANPLPGDYDFNGFVQCHDYTIWRSTFGSTTDLRADGNGNGIVDAADYAIWADAYAANAGRPLADFDGNGVVDFADYLLWKSTFGSTYDLRADANCDGIVDAADYSVWKDTFGSRVGAARFGLLGAAFGPDVPPEVVGFALSLGGASAFDFALASGSGEQLRSIPLASPRGQHARHAAVTNKICAIQTLAA